MLVSEKAKKYGIATDLPEKVDPKDGALVLQYDLRLQNGLECGGAYLKFLQPQVCVIGPDKDFWVDEMIFGPNPAMSKLIPLIQVQPSDDVDSVCSYIMEYMQI